MNVGSNFRLVCKLTWACMIINECCKITAYVFTGKTSTLAKADFYHYSFEIRIEPKYIIKISKTHHTIFQHDITPTNYRYTCWDFPRVKSPRSVERKFSKTVHFKWTKLDTSKVRLDQELIIAHHSKVDFLWFSFITTNLDVLCDLTWCFGTSRTVPLYHRCFEIEL